MLSTTFTKYIRTRVSNPNMVAERMSVDEKNWGNPLRYSLAAKIRVLPNDISVVGLSEGSMYGYYCG